MKRLPIIVILLAMILTCGLLTYYGTAREPHYQGRSLSEWLEQTRLACLHCADPEHPERDPEYLACKIAINHMGTNCIPFLFEDLQAKDSTIRPKISALANQPLVANLLPRKWIWKLRMIEVNGNTSTLVRQADATFGFGALETNAAPAVPTFLKLIADTDRDRRFWGFCAYASIKPAKPDFLPVALQLMKDPDKELRGTAAGVIQNLYPEEAERAGVYVAFPELIPQTNEIVMPFGNGSM